MVTSKTPEDAMDGGQAPPPKLAAVGREARASAVEAAKDMLEQVPKLLPLLGVLCYGLGLLIVDGFYKRLNTTPDAAGIGYLSVIEPAAVWAAVLAVIAVAIVMAFDVVKPYLKWLMDNILWLAITLASLATAVISIILFMGFFDFKQSALWRNAFVLLAPAMVAIVAIPLQILIKWYRNTDTRKSAWPKFFSIGFALILIVGLCFGAHEWGAVDAEKVVRGEPVDVRIFGLDMSAIGAAPVHIQAIDSSPVIKNLSADTCLLEIGSGSYNILLYNPADGDTLSVPLSDVVVISSSVPCKK
jgi:hypothetical protein